MVTVPPSFLASERPWSRPFCASSDPSVAMRICVYMCLLRVDDGTMTGLFNVRVDRDQFAAAHLQHWRCPLCSAVPPEIGVRQEQVISRFKAISEVAGAMEKARRFTSMNGL